MHLKPRHRLRPLSSLLLSLALGCAGSAPEQDSSEASASQAQRLSPSSTRTLPPGLAPSRVKDIQVGTDTRLEARRKSSYSGHAFTTASLGSAFYFTAVEESTGEELWRTDGTREGTRLVRELIPGINGRGISGLATLGDTLFLSTDAATPEAALWKSDGTPEGTVRWELGEEWNSPGNPIVCNGALFFQDFNFAGSWKGLWKSDGSPEGTVELSSREWFLGFDPSSRFACANGMLFFVTSFGPGGEELWRSDGTAEGTVFLGTLGYLQTPWDGSPLIFAAGAHVFIPGSYSGGLWTSDGTPEGTTLLGSGGTGDSLFYAESLTPVGERLFFIARDSQYRQGLWTSDSTAAGTQMLTLLPWGPPPGLVTLGDTLLFSAGNTVSRSNGTPEGTVLLENLDLTLMSREGARLSDGRWLIVAKEGNSASFSLWVTDGTRAGTTPLQLEGGQGLTGILGLRRHGDQVVFWADDGLHGTEPWITDGTPAGTRMLRDIFRGDSSNPQSLLDMGGTLFFTAYDSEHGRELWKSDGTAEGTVLVKDTSPIFSDIGPSRLTRVGETLFFFLRNELWKSDGTEAGTLPVYTRLQSTSPGATGSLGTTLFFTTFSSPLGSELWTSDGTPEGTRLFKDLHPGPRSANPTGLTQVGSTLFFAADDGVHGVELWKTDGTPEGTVLIKDIRPGSPGSFISGLVNVGGTLFFVADDGLHGRELWKSDGTAEGTVLVVDLAPRPTPAFQPVYQPAPSYSEGGPLYVIDGTLYFTADDGAHGAALWKSDGTSEGTVLLHDHTPGAQGSALWNVPLVAVGPHGTFAFPAPEALGGLELWMSDGTTEGTRLLHDIAPGGRGSSPSRLTVSGSRLFFVADEGEHGRELWSVKHAAFQHRP